MNITLKRLQVHERLSEETLCYSADIIVDGKKVGTTENRGCGGMSLIWWSDKSAERAVTSFVNSLPEEPPTPPFEHPFKHSVDSWIDTLAEKLHYEKKVNQQMKRWCKKDTVFRLKGDKDGSWRTVKHPFCDKVVEFINTKYGDKVEEILNYRFM